MKLMWNKNPKKRSRVALSNFPDLPFEKDDAPESQSHRQFREDDIGRRQITDQLDSSDHPREKFDLEAKDLAESIRAQGDKLAEVNQLYIKFGYFNFSNLLFWFRTGKVFVYFDSRRR